MTLYLCVLRSNMASLGFVLMYSLVCSGQEKCVIDITRHNYLDKTCEWDFTISVAQIAHPQPYINVPKQVW